MSIMKICQVTCFYDKGRMVLDHISAEFEAGKIYAILGPSGCGKTTLLSLLGGLDSPVGGQVLFQGEDIEKKGLAWHRKHNAAFIFQNYFWKHILLSIHYRHTRFKSRTSCLQIT